MNKTPRTRRGASWGYMRAPGRLGTWTMMPDARFGFDMRLGRMMGSGGPVIAATLHERLDDTGSQDGQSRRGPAKTI